MHIDRLEKAGKFPLRVHLTPGTVAWVEGEIDEWLQRRIAERRPPYEIAEREGQRVA
ncbi:MAG TPA: AlpA family phage regulatory protein [Aliidongia sp.]|uniref:helix-turn-helix transcriptional regulator n=1 Tax=Aliidongia sp. TaxID=1914230 RepID=UPI002DDCED34|nr:AlpA family phage regulatory protein [Aliidongia sp.]HEV2678725.1 AlpA family phage regulatory protein [Aliidongia sp.]